VSDEEPAGRRGLIFLGSCHQQLLQSCVKQSDWLRCDDWHALKYGTIQIAKMTGDQQASQRANELALKAVQQGTPEIQARFHELVSEAQQKGAGTLPPEQAVHGLADRLKEQSAKTQAKLDRIDASMKQLESISSPEEFLKVMTAKGLPPEALHKAMTGGEEEWKELMATAMQHEFGSELVDEDEKKEREILEETLEHVDALAQETRKLREAGKAPGPTSEQTLTPAHVVRILEEGSVISGFEVKVDLPTVDSMEAVQLDVSDTQLRLCADRNVLRLGPFEKAIDPQRVAARFSKKRRQLTVMLQVP